MRDRSIAGVIFGFLLACYLLTYTGVIQSSDGLAMFATTESVVRHGVGDSNQLLWMGNQQGNIGADGNLYSRKGLGMTLLALPLVALARVWGQVGLVHTALILNPLLTALTGALIYRAGIRVGWQRAPAVATALIFGLATMAWPYTQTFFSDPVSGFGLFAAFYGLLSFAQTGRKRYLATGALAWGTAYLARAVNLITLPVYLVGLWIVLDLRLRGWRRTHPATPLPWSSVLRLQWRPLVSFLIPVIAAGLLSLWWNWLRFGSIWDSGYVESESFSGDWLAGIFGLTVGPARGLIWYNPVLLLAIPGVIWFWRHARQTLAMIAAITILYVLLYAKWYMWHGGYSWGPRFLVPVLPFVALLVGPVWERLELRRRYGWLTAALLWALVLLSVGVQWLGMVVPFGLVQDWLAAEVQPLFAPETFTRLAYSPLLLQWRFISSEHIIFAWWRGGAGLAALDWFALLMPLSAIAVGALLLWRQARWLQARRPVQIGTSPQAGEWNADAPRNYLYFIALILITFSILTWQFQIARATELATISSRIEDGERRGDVILNLTPTDTQQLANTYHGRLPTFGVSNGMAAQEVDELLARFVRRDVPRVWVVPDSTAPEASPWEMPLRAQHFLLAESRPAGADGRRMALYALDGVQTMTEFGLGTIFGDPALAGGEITAENGWIQLAGYGITPQALAGHEILLVLRWQSLQAVDANYQVFVHLLDSNGEKIIQRDGQPVQWMRPTSTWQPGEAVDDRYGIPLPADLPPGIYQIDVGLYDPVTGTRLPINAGPGDFAVGLGPVVVRNP